jgi:HemY protein
VYGGLIQEAARHKQTSELAAIWNDAPKSLRQDELMLASLANSWLTLGQPDEAERILETALDQQCTPALLRQWLALPPKDPARAVTRFNRWANQITCQSDTNLRAYAQARLAWLNDDTEGAKQALAPVLNDQPDVSSLKLAAQIAEHERDSTQAVVYYTKAFERMDLEK